VLKEGKEQEAMEEAQVIEESSTEKK